MIRAFSGADRSRTGVQTYLPLAFYMLISELFVGERPELNKPIVHLAEWSYQVFTALHLSITFLFLIGRRNLATCLPVHSAIMDANSLN
jgi:hypothetical protein